MRFVGALTAREKKILKMNEKWVAGKNVQVLGSGSFSFEQVISEAAKSVWSNDISLLSIVLGDCLLGRERKIKAMGEKFKPLQKYLDDGDRFTTAGAVLFVLGLSGFYPPKNLYKRKFWDATMKDLDELVLKNTDFVREYVKGFKIDGMLVADAGDCVRNGYDWVNVSYLPFYSGGYEKLYALLDIAFEWDSPSYEVIDEERYMALCWKISESNYVLIADREIEVATGRLVYEVRHPGLKTAYFYTNMDDGQVLGEEGGGGFTTQIQTLSRAASCIFQTITFSQIRQR